MENRPNRTLVHFFKGEEKYVTLDLPNCPAMELDQYMVIKNSVTQQEPVLYAIRCVSESIEAPENFGHELFVNIEKSEKKMEEIMMEMRNREAERRMVSQRNLDIPFKMSPRYDETEVRHLFPNARRIKNQHRDTQRKHDNKYKNQYRRKH